jgi:hypothetical protein
MNDNDAVMLIGKAAIMLAQRNPDGSVNEDRVNAMVEKLLAAAEIILNIFNDEPQRPAPKPKSKPDLRLVPKSTP